MNPLDQLIELSPYPVIFAPGEELVFDVFGFAGFMVNSNTVAGYLSPGPPRTKKMYIKMNVNISKSAQISTLAHEIGHALCSVNNCKCQEDDHKILAEHHANMFCLKYLLKTKQAEPIKAYINLIERQASFKAFDSRFVRAKEAAKKIMKLKLWEKCKKFVEEK